MNWELWKQRLIRHAMCLLFAWMVGPLFASWTAESLVGIGFRGDFTPLDWFWRVVWLALFELAWFYASRRESKIPR